MVKYLIRFMLLAVYMVVVGCVDVPGDCDYDDEFSINEVGDLGNGSFFVELYSVKGFNHADYSDTDNNGDGLLDFANLKICTPTGGCITKYQPDGCVIQADDHYGVCTFTKAEVGLQNDFKIDISLKADGTWDAGFFGNYAFLTYADYLSVNSYINDSTVKNKCTYGNSHDLEVTVSAVAGIDRYPDLSGDWKERSKDTQGATNIQFPDPIANYHHDEESYNGTVGEVLDASGNNYVGKSVEYSVFDGVATTTDNTSGKICAAVDMDERHQSVQIPHTAALEPSTITLAAWVKLGDVGSDQTLIFKSQTPASFSDGYSLQFIDSGDKIRFHIGDSSSHELDTGNSVISVNTWHHVAATYDGISMKIYVDGSLEASNSSHSGVSLAAANNNPLMIGSSAVWGIENGYIDEVKVFDASLVAADISTIYTNENAGNYYDGSAASCPVSVTTPMTQLLMDECSWDGTTDEVVDRISSNHGTSSGGIDTFNGASDVCLSGEFTNSGDKITIDHNASMEASSFTASVRFYPTAGVQVNDYHPIFTKSTSQGGYYDGYGLFIRNDGYIHFYVGNSVTKITPQLFISEGNWYDVTVKYDGSYLRIYFNGVSSAYLYAPGLSPASGGDLLIGSDPGNRYFQGNIDEFTYYNSAISDGDILDHYQKRVSSKYYDDSARTCAVCPGSGEGGLARNGLIFSASSLTTLDSGKLTNMADEDLIFMSDFTSSSTTATTVNSLMMGDTYFVDGEMINGVDYDETTGKIALTCDTSFVISDSGSMGEDDIVLCDSNLTNCSRILDGGTFFDFSANIDAVSVLSDGRIALSPESDEGITALYGNFSFDREDVYLINTTTHVTTSLLDGSAKGLYYSIDGVHVSEDLRYLWLSASSSDTFEASNQNLNFQANDIILYDRTNDTVEMWFDGSANMSSSADILALSVFDADNFVQESKYSMMINLYNSSASYNGGGLSNIEDDDIAKISDVSHNFLRGTATQFMEGGDHFSSSENLDGIHYDQSTGKISVVTTNNSRFGDMGSDSTNQDIVTCESDYTGCSRVFDGSTVFNSTSPYINGISVLSDNRFAISTDYSTTTKAPYNVISFEEEDVVVVDLDNHTVTKIFDGGTKGVSGDIDGLHVSNDLRYIWFSSDVDETFTGGSDNMYVREEDIVRFDTATNSARLWFSGMANMDTDQDIMGLSIILPEPTITIFSDSGLKGVAGVDLFDFSASVTDDDVGSLTYAWDFNDSSSSIAKNPQDHLFATKKDYNVTCIVTNSYGVSITSNTLVMEINQTAPSISGAPSTSVNEDTAYSFTPSVTDPDSGDTKTFSIVNKPNWASFSTTTGALTGTPTNSSVGTFSNIQITVKDIINQSDTLASFSITVNNVNDVPIIFGTTAGQAVNDNSNLTPFSGVTITDLDTANLSVSIALDNNAKGSLSTSSIASNTIATVQTALRAIVYTPASNRVAPASTETTTFTVTVSDGAANVVDSVTTVVSTSINDAPTISGSPTTSLVEEVVYSFVPTGADNDTGDSLTYSIANKPSWASFNTSTGALTGTPSNSDAGTYSNITITVKDAALAADSLAAFTITVTDSNANPVITSNGGGATAAINVAENSTAVTTVTSSDANGDTVTYSISGGADSAKFTLTGAVLTFTGAPDYETATDDGANNTYVVEVTATDDGAGTLTDTQTITVTVNDVNEDPIITSNGGGATAAIDVAENTTAVTTVTSSDVDGDTVTYSLSGGADQASFGVVSATGVLTFNSAPDFETKNSYVVEVTATDDGTGTLTDTQTITVTITDSNENPEITSNGSGATASINVAENTTAVTTVTSSDVDGDTVTYSLSGGADQASFGIVSATGVLTFNSAPDFETKNSYVVEVTATDDGVGTLTDVQTITVTVTDVNDVPVVTGTSANQAVNDNSNLTPFSAVNLSDADGDNISITIARDDNAKGTLSSNSIASGTAASVQTSLRAIIFTPTSNRVAVGGTETTTFTLTVNDGTDNTIDAVTTVISTSINDIPTVTNAIADEAASEDSAYTFTFVANVFTDVDVGDSLTYTATKGNGDALPAWITFTAGTRTFSGTPDNSDIGTLSVKVTATDASAGAISDTFDIVVSNVNDAPTIGGTSAGQAVNDNATNTPFSLVTLGDADNNDLNVTLILDDSAKGSLSTKSIGSGTIAATQLALRTVVFTPTANRVAVASTETTTITIVVSDGFTTTSNVVTTIVSTSINDVPTAAINTVSVNEDTNYSFTGANFNFSDVDVGDTLTSVKVTTLESAGALLLNASDVANNEVIAIADISAGKLLFEPALNANGAGYATFSFSVNDSHSDSAASYVMTINVNAVNDAPTVTISADKTDVNASDTQVSFSSVVADLDGSVVSYLWHFNDTTTSTDANPTNHIFENEGEYNVTCTVTDNGGLSTTSDILLVSVGAPTYGDKILLNEVYVKGSEVFVELYTVNLYSTINATFIDSVKVEVCAENDASCTVKDVTADCTVNDDDHFVVCTYAAGELGIIATDTSDVSVYYKPASDQYFLDYLEINGQIQADAASKSYSYDTTSPATGLNTVDIEREPDGTGSWQLGPNYNTKLSTNMYDYVLTLEHNMSDCVYGNGDIALDGSGNSYDATNINTITKATGKVCDGFDLSSSNTNDYIKLNPSAINGNAAFGISFWIKPISLSNGETLLSGDQSSEVDEELLFNLDGGFFTLTYRGTQVTFTHTAPDDSWHHIVLSKNSREICMILDGNENCQTGNVNLDTPLSIDANAFVFGRDVINGGGDYDGLVDELLIFSTPLNESVAQEFYANYNLGANYDYLGDEKACNGRCVNPMAYQDEIMINEVHAKGGEHPFIEIFTTSNFDEMNASDISDAKVEWCEDGGSCVVKSLDSTDCNLSTDKRFLTCLFNSDAFSLVDTKDSDVALYFKPNVSKSYFNYLKINDGSTQSDANQSRDANDFRIVTEAASVGVDRYADGTGTWEIENGGSKGLTNDPTVNVAIAEYKMDTPDTWNGSTNEVNDTIGGYHGIAVKPSFSWPVTESTADAGGLCHSGNFAFSQSHLSIPHNVALNPNSNKISISARFKRTSDTFTYNYMVHKTTNRSNNNDGYGLRLYTTQDRLDFFIDDEANLLSTPNGSFPAADNSWHHVVATYDGSEMKMYIDGVFSVSAAYSGLSTASTGNLFLGGDSWDNFYGHIDEVKIFDYALSAKQVNTIYTNESAGKEYNSGVLRVCGSSGSSDTNASRATRKLDAWESTSTVIGDSTDIGTKISAGTFGVDVYTTIADGSTFVEYNGTVKARVVHTSTCATDGDDNLTGWESYEFVNEHAHTYTFTEATAQEDVSIQIAWAENSRTCSTDNFAIRPDHYEIEARKTVDNTVLDTNATTGGTTGVALQNFNLFVSAVGADDEVVQNYNGSLSLSAQSGRSDMVRMGAFDYNTSKIFVNGRAKVEGNVTEVGVFMIFVDANNTFAAVDNDEAGSASLFTIDRGRTIAGRFIPDTLRINHVFGGFMSDIKINNGCNYTYFTGDNDLNVTARLDTNISALNLKGAVTQNYNSGSFSEDASFSTLLTYDFGTESPVLRNEGTVAESDFNNGVASIFTIFKPTAPGITNRQTAREAIEMKSVRSENNITTSDFTINNFPIPDGSMQISALTPNLSILYGRLKPIIFENGSIDFYYELYAPESDTDTDLLEAKLGGGITDLNRSVSSDANWYINPRHQMCDDINLTSMVNVADVVTIRPENQLNQTITTVSRSVERLGYLFSTNGGVVTRERRYTGVIDLGDAGSQFDFLFYHPYITDTSKQKTRFKFTLVPAANNFNQGGMLTGENVGADKKHIIRRIGD
jgi:hypothetical protein